MPRGPRRYFLAVPVSQSQRSAATSSGICPADWHASSRNFTPCRLVMRPTPSASYTLPAHASRRASGHRVRDLHPLQRLGDPDLEPVHLPIKVQGRI